MSKKARTSARRPDLTFKVDRVFIFEDSNTLDAKAKLDKPAKASKSTRQRPKAK